MFSVISHTTSSNITLIGKMQTEVKTKCELMLMVNTEDKLYHEPQKPILQNSSGLCGMNVLFSYVI